ncbi:MAG: hypothetical protein HKN13_10275 [Rhodothermales bacterium]|nr:hypothetical protein [Rhodothermales bacterium]
MLLLLLFQVGCTRVTERGYGPFVRDLDGKSELEISTYPADFPDRVSSQDAVFERLESADHVYFQFFVRDKNKSGPNPHIDNITVHSFSYRIGDEPATVLLSEYPGNFWMQGNPRYDKEQSPAIEYLPGAEIQIDVALTLNGTRYSFSGVMPATENSSTLPTVVVDQGV